jgi:hypothetical protein
MSDSNSSVVSIVGIIAILVMVGLAIWFFMFRQGDSAELQIEITDPTTEVIPDPPDPTPVALSFTPIPGPRLA